MLKRLIATDFKRHARLEVDFTSGMNLIVGANYKGKSSVLHCLMWILFGPKGVPGQVVRRGAKQASGTLVFDLPAGTYTVKRWGSNAEVWLGDALKAKGAAPVAAFLEDLFGCDRQTFAFLRHARQKQTEALLTLGTGKLNTMIQKLSGVDLVDSVIKRAGDVRTRAEGALEGLVVEDVDSLAADEAVRLARLKADHAQTQQLQLEVNTAGAEAEQARIDLEDARQFNHQQQVRRLERQAAGAAVNKLQEELTRARGNAKFCDELEAELADLTQGEEKAHQAVRETLEFNDRQAEIARDRHDLETTVALCSQRVAELTPAAEQMGESTEALDEALKALDEAREAYSSALVTHQTAQQLDAQLTQASAEAATAEGELGRLVDRRRGLGDAEDLAPLKEARDAAQKACIQTQSDLERLRKGQEEGVCHACNRPFDDHDPQATQAEIDRLEAQLVQQSAVVKAAVEAVQDAESHNHEVERLEEQQAQVTATLLEKQNQLQALQTRADALGVVKDPATFKTALDAAQEARDQADQRQREAVSAHRQRARQEADKREAEALLSTLPTPQPVREVAALREEADRLAAEVRRVAPMASHARLWKDRSQELEAEHAAAAERLAAVPEAEPEKDLVGLEQLSRTLSLKAEQLKQALSDRQGAYRTQYAEWQAVQRRLEAAREAEQRAKDYRSRADRAGRLVKFLRDNRDRFMQEVWDGILAHASSFASAATNGDIERIVRTDKGDFEFVEFGEQGPVDGASGAQQSIMGVAVQLGLGRLLPVSFPAMLFDEPTADMDSEKSLLFTSLLAAEHGQTLLVTHREFDSATADHVITME